MALIEANYLSFPIAGDRLNVVQEFTDFAVETLIFLQRRLLLAARWHQLEFTAPSDVPES